MTGISQPQRAPTWWLLRALALCSCLLALSCAELDGEAEDVVIEGVTSPLSGNVLFVTASSTNEADGQIMTRLNALGLGIIWKSASVVTAADAEGVVAVVISSTVSAPSVGTKFRTTAVPVITWESQLFDDLGMTTSSLSSTGTQSLQRNLVVAAPTHPIASGLSGTVAVTRSSSTFNWGKPNANATRIASIASDSTRAAIFSYERGVAMPGLTAPARRVALFLGDTTAPLLTASGWRLFEQALTWAVSRPSAPGDRDSDRLPDSVETNTGVFVNAQNTGTNPDNADSDGDGLLDGDEVFGTTAGLNLPALGCTPLRKQILIEHDWFDDSLECAAHSHRPQAAQLQMVTDAFRNAPVVNPDGSGGITLIHDWGQGGLFTGGNRIADADGVLSGDMNAPDFQAYKTAHLAANRRGYFHYVIYPHRHNVNSDNGGIADVRGDDFIVSLYCYHDVQQNVAFSVMHELGHNLGLLHGGDVDVNYKPNYNSIMNYAYQYYGVDTDCVLGADGVLDYSRNRLMPLDENALSESAGLCANVARDWNGNGAIDPGTISADINGDLQYSLLRDHDDWANLRLAWKPVWAGFAAASNETVTCEIRPRRN